MKIKLCRVVICFSVYSAGSCYVYSGTCVASERKWCCSLLLFRKHFQSPLLRRSAESFNSIDLPRFPWLALANAIARL